MRKILYAALLIVSCAMANAQGGSIVGKWKPVLVKMGDAVTIDVKKGTAEISDSAKLNWQKDKDPKATEEMMQYLVEAMLQKMKNTEEAYLADGTFSETNTATGRTKKGSFLYKNNLLERTFANGSTDKFTVSWDGAKLSLLGSLGKNGGVPGDMKIVYEKL